MIGRVTERAAFDALRRDGRRIRRGPLSVTYLPEPGRQPPRVAFSIGRAYGSAVARNRIRRRLRAVLRDPATDLDLVPGTYLLGARPEASTLDHRGLVQLVERLMPRREERR